ncbi:cytochrome P450 [Aspergillus mulundensis]|uniref:Cytochrome P450 n=1 Tax=Aspergillus mulundensis TaxID=1810919 RepID=A0A3D8R520_9EURO|nr:hypothetical protein DSM5745_08905 [Aspergillus mulundensis]RDW69145.1 hypothetical protein DSM5745_08905 [Aspergillus mulundensis]
MGGARHNVVMSPSMIKSVLTIRGVTTAPLVQHISKKILGERGVFEKLNPSDHHVFVHNIPNQFMHEPSLSQTSTAAANFIQREAPNLVTFSAAPIDQMMWERPADVTVIEGKGQLCEVDFFKLIRHFVGTVTTTTLFGQAILETFPTLLQDVWSVDDQFATLSMGPPRHLTPGISAAYIARDRLLDALAIFHQALLLWDEGNDLGMEFRDLRDLEDVSEPIKNRVRKAKDLGLSPQDSAPAHLALLWAMNGNSPNIVFYHLLRLYANPTLLGEIRKEIAPFVKVSRPTREETGFPILEAPRLSIDVDGLCSSSELLKASFYETLRLDSAGLSFRQLTADLTLTETEEEATKAGRSTPQNYSLKNGELVIVPHGVVHNDPMQYSNPNQFDPLRFIKTDPSTGQKRAKYETLTPFGGGMPACKGRAFAEKKILALSAAIVSLWEISPADAKELKIPGHKISSAAFLPKNDIRVRISPRYPA